jgi:hypothetical protein
MNKVAYIKQPAKVAMKYIYRTYWKKPKNKIQRTLKKYKKQQIRFSICPAYTEHGPSIQTHEANHGNGRGGQKR